jgi:hypothetical protein
MRIASFLTLVLIKGDTICQLIVGTATLRWGGYYKPGVLYRRGVLYASLYGNTKRLCTAILA